MSDFLQKLVSSEALEQYVNESLIEQVKNGTWTKIDDSDPNADGVVYTFSRCEIPISHVEPNPSIIPKVLDYYRPFFSEMQQMMEIKATELFPSIMVLDFHKKAPEVMLSVIEKCISGDGLYRKYLNDYVPKRGTWGEKQVLVVWNPLIIRARGNYFIGGSVVSEWWLTDKNNPEMTDRNCNIEIITR